MRKSSGGATKADVGGADYFACYEWDLCYLTGEHTWEGKAKAVAVPPRHELRSLGLKMGEITALPFIGKNSSLDCRIKNIKNNSLRFMDMDRYGN
jgi:hypothetical protein